MKTKKKYVFSFVGIFDDGPERKKRDIFLFFFCFFVLSVSFSKEREVLLYGASSLDYAASFYFCFVLYQPTEEEETRRVNKGRQKTGNNLEFLPTF